MTKAIEERVSKYPMNLQLFAEEPPADPEPPVDPQDPPLTFTQADLDRIVADRIARERKKAEKFADYDDIKTKLTALEQADAEREKAKLSDTERLEAEKAEALKRAQEVEERSTAREAAANQRIINAEFRTLAREANVPADRIAAALKLADLSGVTVDDAGDAVGVKEAVEALVLAHAYLVEKTQAKPIGGGGGGGNPDEDERKTLEAQLAEARKAKDFSKVIEISNKLAKK